MQLLELSDKPTFRKNYLLPALEQRHIEPQVKLIDVDTPEYSKNPGS
jgi:hypothetical protein